VTEQASSVEVDVVQPEGQGQGSTGAAEVQPDGGQGQAGDETGLYDLSSVPEDVRPVVEEHLKAIEGNVTRKFQEAAEFRKQWEPLQELGVDQWDPESLEWLLSIGERLSGGDPEAVFRELAEQFSDQGEPEVLDDDPVALVKQELEEQFAPMREQFQEFQQQRALQEQTQALYHELQEIEGERGEKIGDDELDELLEIAAAQFMTSEQPLRDAIGFRDRIASAAQKRLVSQKLSDPQAAEGGGRASTQVLPPATFEEAKEAALARFTQSNLT
jgi:hypothetical protein